MSEVRASGTGQRSPVDAAPWRGVKCGAGVTSSRLPWLVPPGSPPAHREVTSGVGPGVTRLVTRHQHRLDLALGATVLGNGGGHRTANLQLLPVRRHTRVDLPDERQSRLE
jgi:hypothetical protein